jgi:hypothetical protein
MPLSAEAGMERRRLVVGRQSISWWHAVWGQKNHAGDCAKHAAEAEPAFPGRAMRLVNNQSPSERQQAECGESESTAVSEVLDPQRDAKGDQESRKQDRPRPDRKPCRRWMGNPVEEHTVAEA